MTKSDRVWRMVTQLRVMLLVSVLASLLSTSPAHASSMLSITATVHDVGLINVHIDVTNSFGTLTYNGNVYAGNIVPSYLDGIPLPFLYCVDVLHDVYVPTPNPHSTSTGYSTVVTFDGTVHGQPVNNAAQVAWLLDTYAFDPTISNDKTKSAALQAAIWEVIYGPQQFTLLGDATVLALYNTYYTSSIGHTASVENYAWLSPTDNLTHSPAQGLVTHVPEPGSTLLLALALSCLSGVSWWRRKR